ncbi:MAG: DUF1028 domain-containing protein [bacterium]|nr:DUF1028 domain-containing protein [bacterium]MDE0438890.1 DUF1028 domain-containing protein [bacterium]
MTYTILGCDSATGRVGIGIATHSIAAGGYCQVVRSGIGAIASQAYADPRLLPVATDMLERGLSPAEVVTGLADVDPDYAFRQTAVLTPDGVAAAHTGDRTGHWSGHVIGDGYIATGNSLEGEGVVEAMADAFESAAGSPVEDRLVAGLEAGRDAGGQVGDYYERSATLVVAETDTFPDIDLRIDFHASDAVGELRSLLHVYRPYLHIYNHVRTKEPRQAVGMTYEEWNPLPPEG